MKKENGVSKILIVLIIFVLLCVLGVVITIITYNSLLKPVQSNSEKVIVSISEGSGVSGIAIELEKSGIIKNADAFKVYCKINIPVLTVRFYNWSDLLLSLFRPLTDARVPGVRQLMLTFFIWTPVCNRAGKYRLPLLDAPGVRPA